MIYQRPAEGPGHRTAKTACWRQILPGRLRPVNHKRAKLPGTRPREDLTMRIYGPNGTTIGSPAGPARRTSSTGFSLPEDVASTQETRPTVAPKAAANIDALLA